jgi:hypothetical protein
MRIREPKTTALIFASGKIQNIVGSCDIKFPIRLEGLASRHHNFSSYEPELFPGLIYRMIKPKIVLLIFVSGKIVLTGAKVREEIYQAFEMIYPVLQGKDVSCPFIPWSLLTLIRFQESLIWLWRKALPAADHFNPCSTAQCTNTSKTLYDYSFLTIPRFFKSL